MKYRCEKCEKEYSSRSYLGKHKCKYKELKKEVKVIDIEEDKEKEKVVKRRAKLVENKILGVEYKIYLEDLGYKRRIGVDVEATNEYLNTEELFKEDGGICKRIEELIINQIKEEKCGKYLGLREEDLEVDVRGRYNLMK